MFYNIFQEFVEQNIVKELFEIWCQKGCEWSYRFRSITEIKEEEYWVCDECDSEYKIELNMLNIVYKVL